MAVSIDQEKEFTDEQVSEWILNRIFNDSSVLDAFSEVNDPNWYKDENLSFLIKIVIKSYKRHGVCPTREAVAQNIRYLVEEKGHDYGVDELISTFNRIVNMTIDVDQDTVTQAIELFVQNSGLYQAIDQYSNSRIGLERKKITFQDTVGKIHKFEEFKLDNDIGLDYFSDDGIRRQIDFLSNPEAKLPTGIAWIDKVTSGGIYRDGHFLGVIAAAPNVGKSIILANLAYNFLKQDLTVLVISLEMSEMVYARRITSLVAGACIDTLNYYAEEAKGNIIKFRDEHPKARLLIKEYPTGGATPVTIESYIEGLERDGVHPDVVVLDYLNLLKPSKFHFQGEKQHIQVGYITKEIRGLSTKFKIPFFSATQSNRSGYDNQEVNLVNISQSTAVAEDADFIVSAYSFDEDVVNGVVKLKVIKSRLGGKNYPAHQFQIDKETLGLIDKGDATIDVSADSIDLSAVATGQIKLKSRKNGENTENKTFEPPKIDSNALVSSSSQTESNQSTVTTSMSAVQQELDSDFEMI